MNTRTAIDIPGLRYIPKYISWRMEESLKAIIDAQSWDCSLKRRVQHYGFRYDYEARTVNEEDYLGPMPSWLGEVSDDLVRDGFFASHPDQVIVNEYDPGQGISFHTDCIPCFGETIVSLSLGWAYPMIFRHYDTREEKSLYLERRSLLVLTGEARYEWRHSIAARKTDTVDGVRMARGRRLSLTFRTVRKTGENH